MWTIPKVSEVETLMCLSVSQSRLTFCRCRLLSFVFINKNFHSPFTDNQATGSNPSKSVAPAARPKGSVIDLTEDDDDVQGKVGVRLTQ